MRSCSQSIYDRAERTGRPCLLGDIGKCSAPCVGRVTLAEHRATANDLVGFMNGGDQDFEDCLAQIEAAADGIVDHVRNVLGNARTAQDG